MATNREELNALLATGRIRMRDGAIHTDRLLPTLPESCSRTAVSSRPAMGR